MPGQLNSVFAKQMFCGQVPDQSYGRSTGSRSYGPRFPSHAIPSLSPSSRFGSVGSSRKTRCACALYYYTEPGDHIGWHYDTSYYKGARYTMLVGLVDKSPQCRLVSQLHKDDPTRETKELRLATEPGDTVIFNGDKLWHAVTPLGQGEERIVLTMEYVTTQEINPLKRIYSNLKDAFAYFGVRTVFRASR